MFTAYVAVTVLAAAANAYSAYADFRPPDWMFANMNRLRVPRSWLPVLGVLKAAGAVGLLVGLAFPAIGVAAALGLVIYFAGAIVFTLRARWYPHIPFPAVWLLLAAAALALRVSAA